jgi:hypothetical protein
MFSSDVGGGEAEESV